MVACPIPHNLMPSGGGRGPPGATNDTEAGRIANGREPAEPDPVVAYRAVPEAPDAGPARPRVGAARGRGGGAYRQDAQAAGQAQPSGDRQDVSSLEASA